MGKWCIGVLLVLALTACNRDQSDGKRSAGSATADRKIEAAETKPLPKEVRQAALIYAIQASDWCDIAVRRQILIAKGAKIGPSKAEVIDGPDLQELFTKAQAFPQVAERLKGLRSAERVCIDLRSEEAKFELLRARSALETEIELLSLPSTATATPTPVHS